MLKKLLLVFFTTVTVVCDTYAVRTQIGDLYYNLDDDNMTAMVTWQEYLRPNNYSGLITADIPSAVIYDNQTYRVTGIDGASFAYCSSLASVTISNSVTLIGDDAFYNCSTLTNFEIPSDVTYIGDRAFYGCSGLTNVTLPNSVTSVEPWSFGYCSGLTGITIPNSVTSIEYAAFSYCIGLENIIIPNSVTYIDQQAFSYCSSLASITISENVTSIENYTFLNCTNLDNVIIPDDVTSIGIYAFCDCRNMTSVVIPNAVTSIGYGAFSGCSSLTSVVIPNSVTSIANEAFSGCSGLTSVIVEDDNGTYDSRDNCNAIIKTSTNTLIKGCQNTIIPNSVTSIEQKAFSNCSGLTNIDIPNSVTSIGYEAFCKCTGLTSVTFGNRVKSIEMSAFSYCSSLASITLPSSIKSIESGTFQNCTALTSVTIPNNIKSIDGYAFAGCSSLKDFTNYATTPQAITGSVFRDVNTSACTLYVPLASVETYANTLLWEDFMEILPIPSQNSTVIFLDWDGTVLSAAEIEEGASAIAPADPIREGYTFIGWDTDFTNVTEDLVVTAQYQINTYNVQFLDWDGSLLKADTVEWSSAATAPANPTSNGYTFIGWDKAFDNVTSDLVVTAQYEFGENTNFTIAFNGNDGSELLSQEVVLKVPAAPEISGFTFIGWRPLATFIEQNVIEIEAVYTSDTPTSAPEVVNPANKAQKLIRDGNVYILRGNKTYTIQGHEAR